MFMDAGGAMIAEFYFYLFAMALLLLVRCRVLGSADEKAFSHINSLIEVNNKSEASKCLAMVDDTYYGVVKQLFEITKWTPSQFYPWLAEAKND